MSTIRFGTYFAIFHSSLCIYTLKDTSDKKEKMIRLIIAEEMVKIEKILKRLIN